MLPRFIPITPMMASLWEIRSDLPKEISENIVAYELDIANKRLILEVYVNEENLSFLVEPTSVESISIMNHDKTGKILLQTDLETITNSVNAGISGDYRLDDVLTAKIIFKFGTIYQETKHD